MFVKVCGLRTAGDVDCAVGAGADAIGFVLAASPRQVDPDLMAELAGRVPEHVLTVAVCRDVPVDTIREAVAGTSIQAVQLHGDYRAEDFAALRSFTLLRGTSVAAGAAVPAVGDLGEDMLLLDSRQAGSGKTWDWSLLGGAAPEGKWLLAGGLAPDTVVDAITRLRPWGVDVSSGVESARGVKDHALIERFVAAARRFDFTPQL